MFDCSLMLPVLRQSNYNITVYCLDVARVTVILRTNIALCRYRVAELTLTVTNDNRAHARP